MFEVGLRCSSVGRATFPIATRVVLIRPWTTVPPCGGLDEIVGGATTTRMGWASTIPVRTIQSDDAVFEDEQWMASGQPGCP